MHEMANLLCNLSVALAGLFILGVVNPLLITLAVDFWLFNRISKADKEQVWDALSMWWRKNRYMENITTDFAAAKDIRMFGLTGWLMHKYRELMAERYEKEQLHQRIWQRQRLMTCITMLVSQGLIYAWLIYAVVTGRMTLGGFTLYVSSYNTFAGAVWMVMRGIAELLARSRKWTISAVLWILTAGMRTWAAYRFRCRRTMSLPSAMCPFATPRQSSMP